MSDAGGVCGKRGGSWAVWRFFTALSIFGWACQVKQAALTGHDLKRGRMSPASKKRIQV